MNNAGKYDLKPRLRLLSGSHAVVLGLGSSGMAASRLLNKKGAKVVAWDALNSKSLQESAIRLQRAGIRTVLGGNPLPSAAYDLAVLSPGISRDHAVVKSLLSQGIPVIGELELGYQQTLCPNIAITGTNGKTTTTELVERVLSQAGKRTLAAGNIGLPLCEVVDRTADLDYITLEASSFQMESIERFHPGIAVLLNLTSDHLDRYANMEEYICAKARIFENQEPYDWAIVQTDALAWLRQLNIPITARLISLSATNTESDIYLEDNQIKSRLAPFPGVMLEMSEVALRGLHNAENIMAALAVASLLGLRWESVLTAIATYRPAAHRCELVAEINGIRYVNDSKATNVDALKQALLTLATGPENPNIWLIAGGKDKGFNYEELGPLLRRTVKGAFLLGETRDKIRISWESFTPCTTVDSLLEGVSKAAERAKGGDVVLLSPACSSFDMFRNYEHRGEMFRMAVHEFTRHGRQHE